MEEILASIRRIISEDETTEALPVEDFSTDDSTVEQRITKSLAGRSARNDEPSDAQNKEIDTLDLRTVAEVLESLNCSDAVKAAIFDNGRGSVNIAALLTGVTKVTSGDDQAVQRWNAALAKIELESDAALEQFQSNSGKEARLSAQARFVFADAEGIRRLVSPRSPLKLRHLLASLLTIDFVGTEGELLQAILKRTRHLDPALLLAEIIRDEPADGDSIDAWRELFVSRGAHQPASTAVLDADDPWAPLRKDNLGATTEAEAFARTAIAPELSPPFAVGIFGDWGAGKSFFMKLIHDAIRRLGIPLTQEHGEIVQIRFNAWHYTEGNLWASLVDHMFRDLDLWSRQTGSNTSAEALFGQLATARRLTLEAAEKLVAERRGQRIAKQRSSQADIALDEARQALERRATSHFKAIWSNVVGALKADGQLEADKVAKAAEVLGVPRFLEEGKNVGDEVQSLMKALKQPSFKALRDPLTCGLVVLAGIVGFAICSLAKDYIATHVSIFIAQMSLYAGAFTPAILALGIARQRLAKAGNILKNHQTRVVDIIEGSLANEHRTVDIAKRNVAAAEADAHVAREALSTANANLVEAERAFDRRSPGRRLLAFVQERAGSEDYAKHLSLTATIRRDFEELSALLAKDGPTLFDDDQAVYAKKIQEFVDQNDSDLTVDEIETLKSTLVEKDAPRRMHRIVLYIDDLDRCPPHRVVEVLQAVHLLLSFRLFVVFVAVDIRWLSRSLESHYGHLLRGRDESATAATATDYIEKIFQVPFWVQRMESDSAWQLIEDRIGKDAASTLPREGDGSSKPVENVTSDDDESEIEGIKVRRAKPESGESLEAPLTEAERIYLHRIAGALVHSPRRTLRVINIYRLIKASLSPVRSIELEDFDHQAVLTFLAVANISERVFSILGERLHNGATPMEFLAEIDEDPTLSTSERSALVIAVDALVVEEIEWPRLHALVARYTFHGPDAVWIRTQADSPS